MKAMKRMGDASPPMPCEHALTRCKAMGPGKIDKSQTPNPRTAKQGKIKGANK